MPGKAIWRHRIQENPSAAGHKPHSWWGWGLAAPPQKPHHRSQPFGPRLSYPCTPKLIPTPLSIRVPVDDLEWPWKKGLEWPNFSGDFCNPHMMIPFDQHDRKDRESVAPSTQGGASQIIGIPSTYVNYVTTSEQQILLRNHTRWVLTF